MKLLKKYILAERIQDEEEKTSSGLVIVDSRKPSLPKYKIVEIGSDVDKVNVGDTILLSDTFTIKYEGYEIINEDNIIAIL